VVERECRAGSKSPCNTSGSRSAPLGQLIVPISESTRTCPNRSSSVEMSLNAGPHRSGERSTTRLDPSEKWSRTVRSLTTSTLVMLTKNALLGEWVNATRRLLIDGSLPARRELILMEAGPIPNELKGPPWELSVEHGPIEGDPCVVTRVTSMKVGRLWSPKNIKTVIP